MSKKQRNSRKAKRNSSTEGISSAKFNRSTEERIDDMEPSKKRWSKHDLCAFRPLTEKQKDSIYAFSSGKHLALLGSAGTGKTFLGIYLASSLMVDPDSQTDKIIVLRTAVQARDQGFVKGDPAEKMDPYSVPYKQAFTKIFGRANSFYDLIKAKKLVFDSTSFLRSVTFDNAVVIFDEAQNAEFREINTVITRLGQNSRLILIGDSLQDDLSKNEESGLPKFSKIVTQHLPTDFHITTFTSEDIVRSDLVKRWVIGCEEYANSRPTPNNGSNRPRSFSIPDFSPAPAPAESVHDRTGSRLYNWWRSTTSY